MNIKNINIMNYRTINKENFRFSKNINLLVGPNGCGKTNILDAINCCFNLFLINDKTLSKSDFWFGTNHNIEINATINHDSKLYKVNVNIPNKLNHKINIHSKSDLIGYYKYIP